MKHKLLTLILLAISGCDPVECVQYNIENNSDRNIVINFYDSSEALVSLLIDSEQESTLIENCEKGGAGLSLEFYDSIIVYEDNNPVIQYYPSSSLENNIFEVDNREVWVLEKIDDDLTKYTFKITEKDRTD